MDTDPFDLVGDVLDAQFRVDAFVGEGDLSVVYKGHHLGLDAPVAIKCLNLPATLDSALVRPLVDSFTEAGRVHYRLALRNLNIAQSIASGTTLAPRTGALVPYLVREWFEGESLASDLARRRSEKRAGRSPEEAIALLEPVFDGVAFAHSQGVAHLSLNPSNLFLAARGKGEGVSLKVLDFGVARTMNDLVSGIPVTAGFTAGLHLLFPAYAAPEQLDKKVGPPGPWTDVYALALVMMELLSERVVMSEIETGALVERALDEKRRPTPQAHGLKLSRGLEFALSRAVSRGPKQRQKNAEQLWKEVKAEGRARAAPSSQRSSLPTLLGVTAPAPRVVGALAVPPKLASSAPSTETKPMAFEAAAPIHVLEPSASPVAAAASSSAAPPRNEAADRPASACATDGSVRTASVAPALLSLAAPDVVTPLASVLPPVPAVSGISGDSSLTTEYEPPAVGRRWWRWWAEQLQSFGRLPARVWAIGCVAVSAALLLLTAVVLLAPRRQPAAAATIAAIGPAPPTLPEPPTVAEPGPPEPLARFSQAVAWRAVHLAAGVADCRRGNVWGASTATVTFANDGTVSHVAFRRPFAGSATATCVADVLESVHVAPFAGDAGAVSFWFYVAAPHRNAQRERSSP